MSPISIAGVFAASSFLILLFFNKEVDSVKDEYCLPSDIQPINYNIRITPYLMKSDARQFTFDGECIIEIQAVRNTSEIQLHMKNLNSSVSEYYRANSLEKTALPDATPNNLTDIVVYKLTEELQANVSYFLRIVYVGTINEEPVGLYRRNYTDSKNVTKWLAVTNFKTTNARCAFPSFDELQYKARFNISLTRHNSFNTIGPTGRTAIDVSGDYVTDIYAITPRIPTYALGFMVSEFTGRLNETFGVLARPDYFSQTEYSFEVGRRLLKAFGDYLHFPFSKTGSNMFHLAAIPDIFYASENFGLITLSERFLLYDKEHSTSHSKQMTAAVIGHNIAHMWFGNLVTCSLWKYDWLHDAFATYFGYFGTNMVEPLYDLPSQFIISEMQYVMERDATNNTHPLSDEDASTTTALSRVSDSISKSKGATFLRMTETILGDQNFMVALQQYVKIHAYNNTIPSDLFNIWISYWPAEYKQFAKSYFDSQTNQVGYPVVTFNRINETTVEVSQQRFILKDFNTTDPSLIHTVPITFTTSSENNFTNTFPRFFLQQNPIHITVSENVFWIIGNIQGSSYYRVNYDLKTWSNISLMLMSANREKIHKNNLAQIVDDVLNLARARKIGYDVVFSILKYLQFETTYLPWAAALNGLEYIKIRLGNDIKDFARFILNITNKAYKELTFEAKEHDTALDVYCRTKILYWSCEFGHPECIDKARLYFNKDWTQHPVPVDKRLVVYCTTIREGNENDFNKLYNKYMTEKVASEKVLILSTLACVKNRTLVSRFIRMAISDDVRSQYKGLAFHNLIVKNHGNVETILDLVGENLGDLEISFATSIISAIARYFSTKDQMQKLKNFISQNSERLKPSVSQVLKTVEFNLEWSEKNLESVKRFLKNAS